MSVSVVTLLVDPEQAERLTLASTEGKIQLALRNPLDKTAPDAGRQARRAARPSAAPAPAVAAPARAGAAPAAGRPAPRPLPTIEIIRGDKRAHGSRAPGAECR